MGAGNDTREHALTGDGKLLLVTNSLDDSVSVIDIASRQVARSIATVTRPFRVVTFSEGPAHRSRQAPPRSNTSKTHEDPFK